MSCNIHTFEVAIRILKGQRKYILISKLFRFLIDDADYITFTEDELSEFLLKDVTHFTFIEDRSEFLDLQIKLSRQLLLKI